MKPFVIRNATPPTGVGTVDVAIADGQIIAVGPSLPGAETELDATGLMVFPGFIDAHVHFNEPGRTHWEGLSTGSAALAAGGGTTFIDMPLNSDPPVLDRSALETKRQLAGQKSLLDFALWGGLCPGHVEAIDEMAAAGAAGFKAFLCPSGIDEFPAADPRTLRDGLVRASRWNLPVAVHAESPEVLARTPATGTSLRDFFASRPKDAEVAAVRMACEIAGEMGGTLHVVHVTCAEAVAEISRARTAGANITAETCPHYLLFDQEAAIPIGARAKCAPPLRTASDVERLWQCVHSGEIDTIASDHSPAPPERKAGTNFLTIWGGIAGCQHAFPSFLGSLHTRRPDQLALAADWLAGHAANRFRLPQKGRLAPQCDADVTLVAFGECPPVTATELAYRHPFSLYENFRPACRVVHVIRRGEQIVRNGQGAPNAGRGKFLRPTAA